MGTYEYGKFGEDRKDKAFKDPDGNIITPYRRHKGLDVRTNKGDKVKSPVTGTVKRIGDPYGDGKNDIIWIDVKGGHQVGLYYVTPKGSDGKPMVKPGDKIKAGQIVGIAQDIANYHNEPTRMQNHLHLKIKKGGQDIDPTPWFDKWKKK